MSKTRGQQEKYTISSSGTGHVWGDHAGKSTPDSVNRPVNVYESREDQLSRKLHQREASVKELRDPTRYKSSTVVSVSDFDDDPVLTSLMQQKPVDHAAEILQDESQFPALGGPPGKKGPAGAAASGAKSWSNIASKPSSAAAVPKPAAPKPSPSPSTAPASTSAAAPPVAAAAAPRTVRAEPIVYQAPAAIDSESIWSAPAPTATTGGSFGEPQPGMGRGRPPRARLTAPPPMFKPGDSVEAQFSVDAVWYRAQVLEVNGASYFVLYSDYGNKEWLPAVSVRPLFA